MCKILNWKSLWYINFIKNLVENLVNPLNDKLPCFPVIDDTIFNFKNWNLQSNLKSTTAIHKFNIDKIQIDILLYSQ